MSFKLEFANTLAGDELFMMNDCERFGMTYGCQPDCPIYERGECELQEENKKQFKINQS